MNTLWSYKYINTLKPKETPLEDLTGEAIEGEGTLEEGPKDPVPKVLALVNGWTLF